MRKIVQDSAEAVPAKSMAASPKKKTTAEVKAVSAKAKVASVYPPTSIMVNNAIKALNEGRGGSSIQAIKKSISSTYKVEPEKFSLRIKKYLKSAVEKGELIQTKGKGAIGSFKLPPTKPEPKKTAAPKKKTAATKKEKSIDSKKAKVSSKKPAAFKEVDKPKVVSKPKVVTSPKKAPAPSKAIVTKLTPVKKLKSPKPKKVIAKKTAVKKTVAKK